MSASIGVDDVCRLAIELGLAPSSPVSNRDWLLSLGIEEDAGELLFEAGRLRYLQVLKQTGDAEVASGATFMSGLFVGWEMQKQFGHCTEIPPV